MSNREELLYTHIESEDLESVRRLLHDGANPTTITSIGRTAIGLACLKKQHKILELLLRACFEQPTIFSSNSSNSDGESDAKKWKKINNQSVADEVVNEVVTPEGMDGLQWEDEIQNTSQQSSSVSNDKTKSDSKDDEWSVLYRYYASVIEKTGNMLANTINVREPHCLDAFRQAPIHYAATVGSYECMELLLCHKAPIDMTTNTGYTALHLAVEQPRIVELLLRYKANPNKLTFIDKLAPIHMAAKIGIIETIQLLKDAGANINITSIAEQTPIHLAIANKQYEAALRLIRCGAKINLEDEKGLTPLYTAIVINNYALAKMLINNGARLMPSQYLLNYTIRHKMTAMTELLVKSGENVNGRDYLGWTPLLLAISQGDIMTLEYLLANGAKINRNDYVLKELHIAVQQSNSVDEFRQLFGILLRHGAILDSLNKWGETPLCLAMLMEKFQIAGCLIKEGANVNGGCTIKANDCILLVRGCKNINLIRLFVNAGLKICWSTIIGNVYLDYINNPNNEENRQRMQRMERNSCDEYLAMVIKNPLSLKQLARIQIRNQLIEKMEDFHFVSNLLAIKDANNSMTASTSNQSMITPCTSTSQSIPSSSCEFASSTTVYKSVLQILTEEITDLPKILQKYLYEFPDLPPVPRDMDIFTHF